MIDDSSYWKNDLLKVAKKLERKTKQKRYTQRTFLNLEKEIFFSFYAIRKLIEAKKLSDNAANLIVSVSSFPKTGKPVTILNRHKPHELYNFIKKKNESLNIGFVCNQIIHSYIFAYYFGEDGKLEGFFFNSDKMRNEKLYLIDINEIAKLLVKIGRDYPNHSTAIFDGEKKDYIIKQDCIKEEPELV